jgi:hypothetical protein
MTYINTGPHYPGDGSTEYHNWSYFTYRRQVWLYGEKRARRIANGKDEATNEDIESWRRLGGK